MIVDIVSNSEVLKVTVVNYVKLLVVTYLVFYKLPQYIFPQKHINNYLDRLIFNTLYMLSSTILILAMLFFLKIFSMITLVASFILLKAGLMYFFEKRNYFLVVKRFYEKVVVHFYDFLDYLLDLFKFGRQYKTSKSLLAFGNFTAVKVARIILFTIALIYIVYDINFINFISLSDRTSDVSMYVEWVAFLNKNILYADNLTIGSYFFSPAIIIFFLQYITNIDSTLIMSLYPTMFFLFLLISIYYVIYKSTGSHNSAIFAVIIYGLYCISPLSKYLLGYVYKSISPHIVNFFGVKIYFSFYNSIPKNQLINYSYIPYIRLNSCLPYEMAYTFTPLYIYFFISSLYKKENYYIVLYAITLFLAFSFHGGSAIYLFLLSVLILINAILFRKIDFKIFKKGILAIFIATVLGNLWVFSVLKYGIPRDFGIAAPILDKIFKTEREQVELAKGAQAVHVLAFYYLQLLIYGLLALLYPLTIIFGKKKRFVLSSIALAIIALILIYLEENLGFPRIVAKSRSNEYLLLGVAIGSGVYFYMFEAFLIKILSKVGRWVSIIFISVFFVTSLFVAPTWTGSQKFYQSINDIQSNTVVLELYRIKKLRRPFSWTVVGYVQTYSRAMDKGFHINIGDFLKTYQPTDRFLKVPTEYVYIFQENIKSSYKGSGEWYFKWKRDLNLQMTTWIQLYSRTHNNIRVFSEKPDLTVYEIDNRNYMKYLYERKMKNAH